MIKIEVNSATFDAKNGVSARTGKPYSIREQEAWAFCVGPDGKPQPHPQRIKLALGDDQAPYAPGLYQLSPASLYVDKYNQLAIRARLAPLPAAAAASPVRAAA